MFFRNSCACTRMILASKLTAPAVPFLLSGGGVLPIRQGADRYPACSTGVIDLDMIMCCVSAIAGNNERGCVLHSPFSAPLQFLIVCAILRTLTGGITCKPVETFVHNNSLRLQRNKPTQKPLVRHQRLSSLLRSSNKDPNALFSPSCEDKTRGQNEDTRSETSETGEKKAYFRA